MRYNEILHEFVIRLSNNVTIQRNPIKPIILNMFLQSNPQFLLRGFVLSGKIYVWDAMDGIHQDIYKRLIREGWAVEGSDPTQATFYLRQRDDTVVAVDSDDTEIEPLRVLTPGQEIVLQWVEKWNS